MRIQFVVISGSEPGRKVLVLEGLVVRFGRTEWADHCFASDPEMAEFHFMVDSRSRRCVLYALGTAETFVNAKPVVRQELHDGDRVCAGGTEFLVRLEGEVAGTTGGPRPLTKDLVAMAAAAMAMPQLCERLKLGKQAPTIAATAAGLSEFCDRLAAGGDHPQAFQARAFTLGKRGAVAWGCHVVEGRYGGQLDPLQAAAWQAAAAWVAEPSQSGCRRAEQAAVQVRNRGPGGWLATAAFWSGDSLAPEAATQPVPPAETLFSQAVAAALTLAIRHPDWEGHEGRYHECMAIADALEAGELVLFEN